MELVLLLLISGWSIIYYIFFKIIPFLFLLLYNSYLIQFAPGWLEFVKCGRRKHGIKCMAFAQKSIEKTKPHFKITLIGCGGCVEVCSNHISITQSSTVINLNCNLHFNNLAGK